MTDSDKERAFEACPTLRSIEPQLDLYAELLTRWQAKINLVGSSTIGSVWMRHFADSGQLIDFGPLAGVWADIGSGAGFPGMVIALLQRAQGVGKMHLIESDTRKAAFLREVSRETEAGAIIHNARCESILVDLELDVITSRAMAALPELFALSRTHVEKGGTAVFLKGRDIDAELTKTPISSIFILGVTPSKIDPGGAIIRISAK